MRRCLLLTALALSACDRADWKGWVYPDRGNLADDIPIGAYTTLEECRASAKNILTRLEANSDTVGDYECGYRCEADEGLGGLNVCEKTEH